MSQVSADAGGDYHIDLSQMQYDHFGTPPTVIDAVFGRPDDTSPMDAVKRFEALNPPATAPLQASKALNTGISNAVDGLLNVGGLALAGVTLFVIALLGSR